MDFETRCRNPGASGLVPANKLFPDPRLSPLFHDFAAGGLRNSRKIKPVNLREFPARNVFCGIAERCQFRRKKGEEPTVGLWTIDDGLWDNMPEFRRAGTCSSLQLESSRHAPPCRDFEMRRRHTECACYESPSSHRLTPLVIRSLDIGHFLTPLLAASFSFSALEAPAYNPWALPSQTLASIRPSVQVSPPRLPNSYSSDTIR